jgi:hypothetical protein
VKLLGTTPSFTENWDSGDFSANPWVLSGDGNWRFTNEVKYEGEYSATMASDEIELDSGIADLSIDLLTGNGGILTCEVLPFLQSPYDLFRKLIDNIVVYEGSSMFWVSPQLTIEPGKRQVTFRLVKNLPNPNEVPF